MRLRLGYALRHALRGAAARGWCPVCERRTLFCREGEQEREQLKCARCFSNPRWRALVRVLEERFPGWRDLAIHEASPSGSASDKLARECARCVQTQWFPDAPRGATRDGWRNEDLERQTFADGAFDLVVTQDVFEHVLDPARGFAEVARTLKPGGAHVFTLPWHPKRPTRVRAERAPDGSVRHLAEPQYHGSPVDPRGSLVVTDWGEGLRGFIRRASGMRTEVVRVQDARIGVDRRYGVVLVSRKPAAGGGARIGP